MKKFLIFTLLFLIFAFDYKNVFSNEMLQEESEILVNNWIQKRKFYYFYHGDVEIDELFYQKLKENIEQYKSSNYFVDLSSLKSEDIKNVKPCKLINFNENYITAIELVKGKNEYEKDENGRIVSMIIKYLSSNIKYKDKSMEDEITIELETESGDEGECGNKIVINNCNNANNGLNCLKQLPDECYIMLPSNNQATCIDLKNDKSALISYACSKDGCFLLDSMVR